MGRTVIKQSVLHDFTNEDNWRQLIEIKILLSDDNGIRAVLEDLFVILGRNPERTNILTGIDLIEHGNDLLEAAFAVDPLDPNNWYSSIACNEEKFDEFGDRLSRKSFVYYDNGNLKSEEFYVNGQKVINWIYFANNGRKESSGATKRGKKHGEWKYFLSDLSYKSGFYQNNKRTEEWEYFSKNGQNYNFVSYYGNNRISELGRIEDDKKKCIWTKYYDNGQLELTLGFDEA